MIMKRLLVCLSVLIFCSLFLTPANSFAQVTTATSEQSLQELVKEVRALRATLQRMSTTVYKGQVMLERLRLHQEQVMRIERELRDTRDNLSDLRSEEQKVREKLKRMDADVNAGVVSDRERASFKAEYRAINQRQNQAMSRETQLAAELETERAKLKEINDKLNVLLDGEL
jgi:predicted  nucleic acid-binding Zn-ribbon protein